MSDIKWIKVAVDMFDDTKIDFLRSLPEGDAIIVIWIQMLSIAGQSNLGGYLMVTEGIPYTEQLLSHKLRRPPMILQFALEMLMKLKMIDIEDGPYHITKWEKHQNIEGMEKVRLQTNERVKKHRQKEKQMIEPDQSNVTVTLQVTPKVTHCNAIEVDKELDLLSTTTTDEMIMDVYTKVFGQLNMNGLMSDYVRTLLNKGLTEVFIKEVMYEVGESSSKPSLNYMKSITERWIKEGISTRVEARRRKEPGPAPRMDKPRTKQQLAVDMEIARNQWIAEGKDPNDFVFEPSA